MTKRSHSPPPMLRATYTAPTIPSPIAFENDASVPKADDHVDTPDIEAQKASLKRLFEAIPKMQDRLNEYLTERMRIDKGETNGGAVEDEEEEEDDEEEVVML
ncbi:hypothetical protein SAICODRAFT_28599 [Saitoella complicata NRRL Y-17804]|uniref:uncharacterized protein n=1 Tax=Saitoella complicata (strain BCRC 22490 / CBS 7301 / JCM 7358 / NBRC 10748 / NRRL Y-17804) TaxID=698492 RepID=UPI000866FDE4|nr:uncharacterized protein SAICODRAFT_28599 [Saitoella complicata NRRL Y-17804]ODQ56458.1 hypothetical protein SAICODRAFT_28599 [Saitoella complicata NRRL Y-17804]